MSIRILTDSTCDLPASIVRAYGISVLPMFVVVGARKYQDGVDLSRQEFYENLAHYQPYPTTESATIESFLQAYQDLVAQGATEILSIHIAGGLSNVVEVAKQAASRVDGASITVFDSRQVSLGMGFQVEAAARLAAEGFSITQIVKRLEDQILRTYVVALLDLLEYMQRSGRMSAVMTGLGKMLKFKPLIRIYNGTPTAESIRTNEKATVRLIQTLQELGPLEKIAVLHSNAAERVENLRKRTAALLPAEEISSVDITPVIGVHTGPGAIGFACIVQGK